MKLARGIDPRYRGRRRFLQAVAATAVAGTGGSILAALASASSPPTLSVAKGVAVKSKIENVVVNSRGLTVYTLSGESAHHLKCTQANGCFSAWFPVKAGPANTRPTKEHGVRGKLGTLHRNGFRQATLRGRLLYTFVGDGRKKGRATGEGIVSFGGTWHVIELSSGSNPGPGPTTTTTSSTTTTTPYYP